MQETKDPAIKLFGKTIPLPADGQLKAVSRENSIVVSESEEMDCDHTTRTTCSQEEKKQSIARSESKELGKHIVAVKIIEAKHEDGREESDNPKTPTIDHEMTALKTSKTSGEEQSDTTNSQVKKPDKILPCPRCNSMETKFCYYNNYNVNQPRHFCKGCQRYWTAGGTMRSVPVGAGRRKNKNSAINYHHMTISEALQAAQIDVPIGAFHAAFENKGSAVLNFGSDASLSESMASGLNLTEKTMWNGTPNVFGRTKKQTPVSYRVRESGDDHSSGSSITDLNSMEERRRNYAQESLLSNVHDFPSQIPCLPGVPWPWPWPCPTVPPPKEFCHPGFSFSLHPASYWGCAIPGTWNVPWLCSPSPPTNQKAPISIPNSPTLGKHSRDGDMLKIDNSEEPEEEEPRKHKCTSDHSIWVPKTLRIDDPDEAAKSSIWETLGINKNDTFSGKGLIKAFEARSGEKNHVDKTSSALQANPAALSRSCNFQESF